MQDDGKMSQKGQGSVESQEEEARLAAEREVLLNDRRARQSGKPTGKSKMMLAVLLAGAAFVFFISVGPSGLMKMLGTIGTGTQTSSVNMEVGREKGGGTHMDFTVPAPPEPPIEKPVDPNLAWNQRFKEMQDKLAEMERKKNPGMTAEDIRTMLSSYNDSVSKKLEEERKAMAAENAKLRAAAERAEEERRRAEEEARSLNLDAKERAKVDKKQRESDSVIVDERSALSGNSYAGENGTENADLDQNQRFLKASASSVVQTSVSQKLYDKSRMVIQGTIISAVLETAIDTQLPGNIRAQVIQPVYAFDGSRVLMPPGTVLIGQFNNSVDIAQKRVLIAWNRAVTPDGKSIAIGSTGTDTLGRAGTLGNVDNRYGTKFGAAMLISAINAVPSVLSQQAGRSGSQDGSGTTINVGGQLASNAGRDLSDQTSGAMEKYLSLPPIVRIAQGEEIRVFVNRDLIIR